MKSWWRGIAFLAVASVALIIAISAYLGARANDQSSSDLYNPINFNVYTSDPNGSVSVEIQVTSSGVGGEAYLRVNGPSAAVILITTNAKPSYAGFFHPFSGISGDSYFAKIAFSKTGNVGFPSTGQGVVLGSWHLPASSLKQSLEHVSIRMPGIALYQQDEIGLPGYGEATGGLVEPVTPKKLAKDGSLDVDGYRFLDGSGRPTLLYWPPANLKSSEIARSVPDLSSFAVDVNNPETGIASSEGFTWTGGYGLQGTLVATDLGAHSSDQHLDFVSGLAFGVAAAALVALIQETPDVWARLPFRRRGRGHLKSRGRLGVRGDPLDELGWLKRDERS